MKNDIQLLIFDLDGTLVDSAEDYQNSLNSLLREQNCGQVTLQEIKEGLGRGLSQLLHKFFPGLTADSSDFKKLYVKFQDIYFEKCTENSKLYPSVIDFLSEWNGHLALVTNKNAKPTHRILEKLGLMKFKWSLISGFDTFQFHKPHPFPLLESLRICNVPAEQALMIGDGLPDLLAAKAAGIPSMAATFGYNSAEFLKSHNPTSLFDDYTELASGIARLRQR